MRRYPGYLPFPCIEPEKEQDVLRDESTPRPDPGREEVGRHQAVKMRANELFKWPSFAALVLVGGHGA
jgi:hypothetical protein